MDGPTIRDRMRAELIVAIAAIVLVVLLWIAHPGHTGFLSGPREWWEPWVVPAGFAGALLGLAWMVRIYRRPLEDAPSAWRHRDGR